MCNTVLAENWKCISKAFLRPPETWGGLRRPLEGLTNALLASRRPSDTPQGVVHRAMYPQPCLSYA